MGRWNTVVTLLFSSRGASFPFRNVMPLNSTLPLVGFSRKFNRRSKVLLPAPLGPTRAKISLGCTISTRVKNTRMCRAISTSAGNVARLGSRPERVGRAIQADARDENGQYYGLLNGGASVQSDPVQGRVLNLNGTNQYAVLPPGVAYARTFSAMVPSKRKLSCSTTPRCRR